MSKTSTATIRLVQKLNRRNKNDEYPIYVVVCWKTRLERSTGVSCPLRFWDSKREIIKKGYPNAPLLNRQLSELKNCVTDEQMQRSCNKASESAIKWVRKALSDINGQLIRENVLKGLQQPLIESEKVVMYTARHSFACHYLSMPNASVSGLASLLSRSPNTIATYIHQLTKDVDIAEEVRDMPI